MPRLNLRVLQQIRVEARRRVDQTVWVEPEVQGVILGVVVPTAFSPAELALREHKARQVSGTPGKVILSHHSWKDPEHRSASISFHQLEKAGFVLVDGFAVPGKLSDTVRVTMVLSRTPRDAVDASIKDAYELMKSKEFLDMTIYANSEVRDGETILAERNIAVSAVGLVSPTNTHCFVFKPGKPQRSA